MFVFGSNETDIHRTVAAKLAIDKFGQMFRLQGQSFAIPTKDAQIKTLSLEKIKIYVQIAEACFVANPTKIFLVTKIGCGLAGYTPEDIAPLFKSSYQLLNVYMPEEFWNICKNETIKL